MENEPDLIRDQMQETRTALTEKIDTLQLKVAETVESITTPVVETVQSVKDAVSDTVDSVKEAVSGTVDSVSDTVTETVDSVKETFNLHHQIEKRPWPIMFGSMFAGYLLGRLIPSPVRQSYSTRPDHLAAGMAEAAKERNGVQGASEVTKSNSQDPGLLSGLGDAVTEQVDKLKGLGISVAAGLLRDLITQSMEGEIGGRLKEWMDDLTKQLGGQPLKEPLVNFESKEELPKDQPYRAVQQPEPSRGVSSEKVRVASGSTPRW